MAQIDHGSKLDFTQEDFSPRNSDKTHARDAASRGTFAGFAPYLRGPYPAMYVTRPWTIRQYTGFSNAAETNDFFRKSLASGQRGLSVAFDLATHRGYDSDHPRAREDVGLAGVAVDSILDMRRLFEGVDLSRTSVSMTMNGAVLPILALYVVAAEEQGCRPEQLTGTIQNDILKEFMVRNTYIYPPVPSMRIVADIFAEATRIMPQYNFISVSGYHIQEAGGSPEIELAYTLANALEYVRTGIAAGLDVDSFAPRISFFWGVGRDALREVAKLRAGRVLWWKLMQQFSPTKPASSMLRAHSQTSGWTLTAQSIYNNVSRTLFEAIAATHGGTQSLHTNSMDEAIALPSEASARVARNSQIFLQQEAGLCSVVDPWGGSHVVEAQTQELIADAQKLIDEVEASGGMLAAIEAGLPQRRIEESSARVQALIDSGSYKIIGVNSEVNPDDQEQSFRRIDNDVLLKQQLDQLAKLKATRDTARVEKAVAELKRGSRSEANLLALSIEAARAGATVGEMSQALEDDFGRYSARTSVRKQIYSCVDDVKDRVAQICDRTSAFSEAVGRAPRLLVVKMGQDGHDRGQKVVGAAFADFGFDVELGPLFQSPQEALDMAQNLKVDLLAISSLAGAHISQASRLIELMEERGLKRIPVIVGGIVPPGDDLTLTSMGVSKVYTPGTNLLDAANELIDLLEDRHGMLQNHVARDEK